MSFEEKVERFARQIVRHHGFRLNEGFACLVPDTKSYAPNEGLFLWAFSVRRKRFETRLEKFHLAPRIKRMANMLGLPEEEYSKLYASIESYMESLKDIGFSDIGKGVDLFCKGKMYNLQADAKLFENNLEDLKKLEELTIKNPIVDFAEAYGYFEVKNKRTLVWDEIFGTKAIKTAGMHKKSSPKSRLFTTTQLSDKLKRLARQKPVSMPDWEKKQAVWAKQIKEVYRKIETWLSEHVKSGYITLSTHKVKLSDSMGDNDYEVMSLELDIVGEHQFVLQPIEMNILGAVGRVDLQHRGDNAHNAMLLLVDKGKNQFEWTLWKNLNEERLPLNKETLEALLNQWVGD